jgi:murein DD-endopeptidase MepM/ murein hydrolase activator NlpD
MPDARAFMRAGRGWRRLAVLGALAVAVVAGVALLDTERRRSTLHDEVRWLRQRLTERRAQLARARDEVAQVAAAVDRLTRTAGAMRERAAQARRLAHMEESRDPAFDVTLVNASLDGGSTLVSEEAARALGQLAWLDGQAVAAGDSMAVLTALLKNPPMSGPSLPTSWPVRGLVTSPFGPRRSPYGDGREVHPGIDIHARYGMPVSAGGDGQVVFAGRDPGYGGLVIVAHAGNVATLYGHLSAIYVRDGQSVKRGQPLGAVGASGRATGAHLHYEVRVSGSPVDPTRYLLN